MDPMEESSNIYDQLLVLAPYNQFFNPNLCHVCKRRFAGYLILCDQCCMISYCNEEHKMSHQPQHEDICRSIRKLLIVKPIYDTYRYSLMEWISLRAYFIQSIELDLGRELWTYEVQMLMYRRSCLICHQQAELRVCEHCCSADCCNEHVEEFRQQHMPICERLLLSLNLDIAVALRSAAMLYMDFNEIPNAWTPFHDTFTFVSSYIQPARINRIGSVWNETDFIYSDYISGPLTLFHGMQDTNLLHLLEGKFFVTIHVISASVLDMNGTAAWELFLHLADRVYALIIIMIGPKLQPDCDIRNICASCKSRGRKFYCEYYSTSYHDYVNNPNYRQPDIIVGFQAELRYETAGSLRMLQFQNCPLFLTATSSALVQENLNKIQEVLGSAITPIFHDTNKFVSYRPHRDLQYNNCVHYRNYYLTIYKNLIPAVET